MRAILTFHSIDDSGSVLSYPVKTFARLLASIAESGIPVLDLDQLCDGTEGVTITFDDGMRSVRENALPVLREFGFPSHLFLTTGVVGADNRWPTQPVNAPLMPMLTWDDVEQCRQSGMLIEAHTHLHPDLRNLADDRIADECATADQEIETRTGRLPRHFAYPYGFVDERVTTVIRKRYTYAVTTEMSFLGGDILDPARLPRLDAYYMQNNLVSSDPFGPAARAYLSVRRILRAIRKGL